MYRIPFILFGDGPRLTSGLARIARDLATQLYAREEELGIQFAQVGIDDPDGWHFGAWPFYGFQPTMQDYGRTALLQAVTDLHTETGHRPVVFTIQDPARVYDLTRTDQDWQQRSTVLRAEVIPAEFWSYFAVDAQNPHGRLGGPAAAAVGAVQRVLAYGQWGAGVLSATLQGTPAVEYLPHGIDTRIFHPQAQPDGPFDDWYCRQQTGTLILGCVAANQPRKDFGLLFATVADLASRGVPVAVWLHTDRLTGASWDVGELVRQFSLRKEQVFVSTHDIGDAALAGRYAHSACTLAVGLGEGFGYPIVESLACGTPVIHGNYGGGVELIPDPRCLVEPVAWRVESVYALVRPVFKASDWSAAVLRMSRSGLTAADWAGSVAHLDWQQLWPAWQQWFETGLVAYRRSHG